MADSKVTDLTSAGTLDGTEVLYAVKDPSGTPLDRKTTAGDIKALVLGTANVFTKAQTFQPDSDAQAGTFRRNSSGQTANIVEIQTEANAFLAAFDKTGALTIGAASGNTGALKLAGTTSGTVTLSTADAAGTWTMKLPTSGGTNNYLLATDGSGNTSWVAPPSTTLTVGSTATSGGAAGQLMFDTGSVLSESSSLVWDNTNKLLTATGLGTGGGANTGGLTVSGGALTLSGNISANAWTTSGIRHKSVAATLTDLTSTGTVATAYTNVYGGNTIAASNATTFTDYFTTFITQPTAGTNVTFTNRWALGLSGNLKVTGDATVTGSLTATNIAGGKSMRQFTPLDNQPPASNFATLDTRNSIAVLDFDDTTNESAVFVGVIPQSATLTSGISVRIHWMATSATSGNCRWSAAFEYMNTDLDSDSFDTATAGNSAANGTSGVPSTLTLTCTTIDSLVSGAFFRVRITREASNAGDTMTGDAELIAIELQQVA